MKAEPPAWAVVTAADRAALEAGYYWDPERAEHPIQFAAAHMRPKYVEGNFDLFEWQANYIRRLYGWRRPDGGRRFRRALLHVPKKNGKTLMVSVIASYELYAARVASPLVASASTTKGNAAQVYQHLANSIRENAKLAAVAKCTPSKKLIEIEKRDAVFQALSADAPASEGLNCSAVIVDEAHAHRSPKLYQALEYAWVGRPDGFLWVISTAGDDLSHWYYALVEQGRAVISGADLDPELLAEVYEADPEKDDLEDPATWKKCNPSLDLYPGFTTEAFGNSLRTAKKRAATWLNFRRYRLNVFTRPEDQTYLDIAVWDTLTHAPHEAYLREYECCLGLDGSQTTDPSSLSAVWLLPGRRFYARSWAWVASAGVEKRERSNLPKYSEFILEGSMTCTPGDVIDKDAIRRHILGLRESGYKIRNVILDPNGLWVFGSDLTEDGFEVYRLAQNYANFTEPTAELANAVAARTIHHDGGRWLRWCLHNVRLDVSENRQRPSRKKSRDKIDGAVSLIMAFAGAWKLAAEPPKKPSIYETEGLTFLA